MATKYSFYKLGSVADTRIVPSKVPHYENFNCTRLSTIASSFFHRPFRGGRDIMVERSDDLSVFAGDYLG